MVRQQLAELLGLLLSGALPNCTSSPDCSSSAGPTQNEQRGRVSIAQADIHMVLFPAQLSGPLLLKKHACLSGISSCLLPCLDPSWHLWEGLPHRALL